MAWSVVSGFVLAFFAPWVHRRAGRLGGWLLALLPLGLAACYASQAGGIASGRPVQSAISLSRALDFSLSFHLDGLSLLFALLISGMGALVLIHSSAYLGGHRHLGRFYAFLLLFMASMLGVALAANLIVLYVFWELTSLTSFLLIGFNHERPEARKAALTALLVTTGGGLALLAGLVLLGIAGGSWEIPELLERGAQIRAHAFYVPALALILLGAFTKSAQWPFHFWLPAAMEAPTPVSAYLHSATMVKAGIYLLARLSPALGDTSLWFGILCGVGGVTMLLGAWVALLKTDLKQILAYSTISVLGMLIMLIGVGTEAALGVMVVYLLAHAFYKGGLFLVAGNIDHEAGSRELGRLGGLWRAMPLTAAAAGLGALSMAGLPPTFGFIGKEALLEATQHAPVWAVVLTAAVMLAAVSSVAVSALVGVRPFWRKSAEALPRHPHEAPMAMWLPPALLAVLGVGFGFASGPAERLLFGPAAAAAAGGSPELNLGLWHGWTPTLALSGLAVVLGCVVYVKWLSLRRSVEGWDIPSGLYPERWYNATLAALVMTARWQTRLLQNGSLRHYMTIIVLTAVGFVGGALVLRRGAPWPPSWPQAQLHEWTLAVAIGVSCVAIMHMRRLLAVIAAMGAVGYGVALLFMVFGGTDLAITQFAIETISVILFLLVVYRLPDLARLSPPLARLRDLAVALALGGLLTALMLAAKNESPDFRQSDYYLANAHPQAHGRNVVNVILVDFRALDTLGEISVLAIAGIGILALLRLEVRPGARAATECRLPAAERKEVYPSLILTAASRYLLPLLLLFAVFLLLRGHDEPGGGFVGGLAAAVAFTLFMLSQGVSAARQALWVEPRKLIGLGLGLAFLSGVPALAKGRPFLTALWAPESLSPGAALGTPFFFDLGVFLVVLGVIMLIFFTLAEES